MLSRLFLRARSKHQIVAGTPAAMAIVRELQLLAAMEQLPGAEDREILLPPAVTGWEHRVRSTHFSVVYTFDDHQLTACTIRIP
jgi:hypothetical protein